MFKRKGGGGAKAFWTMLKNCKIWREGHPFNLMLYLFGETPLSTIYVPPLIIEFLIDYEDEEVAFSDWAANYLSVS